jgi:hypothetical protein
VVQHWTLNEVRRADLITWSLPNGIYSFEQARESRPSVSPQDRTPLIMIFNNVHLLPNNEDGKNLLLQLQQRAEVWCESGMYMVSTTLNGN